MPVIAVSVKEIEAQALRGWLERGEAALYDVREPDERARERIAGSRPAPLSAFDPGSINANDAPRIVMHCKGGVRSKEAAARLAAATGREIFSLRGGLDAWKSQGLPVESALPGVRLPISVMRQVQLVVGTVVATMSVLAIVASPWFAAIAGLMGAGLVFAGATGTCGMAALLARMPWNKTLLASCETGAVEAAKR